MRHYSGFNLQSKEEVEKSISDGGSRLSFPDDWEVNGGEFVFCCPHFTQRWDVKPAPTTGMFYVGPNK